MLINKKQRRYFIKTLLSLGFFSVFPFKIKAENQIDACNITTSDIEGPYYIPNSPNVSVLTPPEVISDFLFITGTGLTSKALAERSSKKAIQNLREILATGTKKGKRFSDTEIRSLAGFLAGQEREEQSMTE